MWNFIRFEYTQVGLPDNRNDFISQLKKRLKNTCNQVDDVFPKLKDVYIDDDGYPRLKKKVKNNPKYSELFEEIRRRMPERKLLDIMCNIHQLSGQGCS